MNLMTTDKWLEERDRTSHELAWHMMLIRFRRRWSRKKSVGAGVFLFRFAPEKFWIEWPPGEL